MRYSIFWLFTLFVLIGLSDPAFADTNFIPLSDTTHVYSGGTGPSSIDGNWNTAQEQGGSGEYNSSSDIVSEHTFAVPRIITEIRYRVSANAHVYGDDEQNASLHWSIQYYDGSWHDLSYDGTGEGYPDHLPYTKGCGGNCAVSDDSGQRIIYVNLSNVTKIKAWCSSYSHSNGDSRTAESSAHIYEIQVFGVEDIGLRVYDGAKVIKIACEPARVLSSPLKIQAKGITYSIVLVDPQDRHASKIKIKTKSGVKSLAKID